MGFLDVGRPIHISIDRRGEQRDVTLALQRRSGLSVSASDWVRLGRALLTFSLALLVAFSRPNDTQARLGALLLAEVGYIGLMFLRPTNGLFTASKALPVPLHLFIQAPLASPGVTILFAFAATFPRRFFRGAWAWAIVWFPQLAMVAIRTYYYIYLDRVRGGVIRLPTWLVPLGVIYFSAAVVIFILNYRRLEHRHERQRARVVAIGTIVLVLSMLPYYAMLHPKVAALRLDAILMSPGIFITLNVLTVAFPLSIAYAILRHRAFDISVVIRQGLKYAVARRTLVAMLPVLGAILVVDLLMHGDQPLGAILRERGWIYAGLGVAALVAHRNVGFERRLLVNSVRHGWPSLRRTFGSLHRASPSCRSPSPSATLRRR